MRLCLDDPEAPVLKERIRVRRDAVSTAFLGELLGSRCGVEDLGTCKVAVGEHFHDADGHGSASTRASYAA